MKNLKKNLFGIGVAVMMALGLVFSITPEEAEARSERIPCASNASVTTEFYYIPCDTCQSTFGFAAENEGKCKS